MIRLEGLTKYYNSGSPSRKHTIGVEDLNLQIEQGEFFGILGPNGAGKTTILKLLVGLLFPSKGKIIIAGKPISIEIRKKIGFVPENPLFYRNMSSIELLQYFSSLFGKRRMSMKQAEQLIGMVGLESWEGKRIGSFSKGMVQRLAVAQSLVNDPEILILDEPLTGLDPLGRKLVKDLLIGLNDTGKTIIFSTHILSEVEEICTRVGILRNGRLIKTEPLEVLLSESTGFFTITVSGMAHRMLADRFDSIEDQNEKSVVMIESRTALKSAEEFIVAHDGVIEKIEKRAMTLENYFAKLMNEKKTGNETT
jgi:ABC-2 type transport system ATP-binding protein